MTIPPEPQKWACQKNVTPRLSWKLKRAHLLSKPLYWLSRLVELKASCKFHCNSRDLHFPLLAACSVNKDSNQCLLCSAVRFPTYPATLKILWRIDFWILSHNRVAQDFSHSIHNSWEMDWWQVFSPPGSKLETDLSRLNKNHFSDRSSG